MSIGPKGGYFDNLDQNFTIVILELVHRLLENGQKSKFVKFQGEIISKDLVEKEQDQWVEMLARFAFLPPTSHIRPDLSKTCLRLLTKDEDHYY